MEDKKSRLVGLIKRFPEGGVNMNKKLKIIIIIFLSVICGLLSNATANAEELIRVGDTWRYFKGTSAPPSNWNTLDFDDSAWLQGPTGIGYNADKDVTYATNLTDMMNNYVSFYARRAFSVSDPALFSALELHIRYDDSFIAYINGQEVARSPGLGTPGTPFPYNVESEQAHDESWKEELYTIITVGTSLLKAGNNVLAIQIQNGYLISPDAGLIPSLNGITNLPPKAAVSADYNIAAEPPQAVNFSAAGSSDSDGTIVDYAWNFGDGSAPQHGVSPTISHTYTAQGAYDIVLTVTDDDGAIAVARAGIVVGPARTFYIADPKGIDGIAGTADDVDSSDNYAGTEAKPFATLHKAAAVAIAGDTVLIRGGTYVESLCPRNSGIAGNSITFQAHPGETVILRDAGPTRADFTDPTELATHYGDVLGIYMYGKSYITIKGLTVADVGGWARIVNSNHIVIRDGNFTNATVRGTTAGIKFYLSDDNIVRNNVIDGGEDNLRLIHSDRNLVEGNSITSGRHSLWGIVCGNFNVIRDNYFYNAIQKIGEVYDYDGAHPPVEYDATKHNLIEGNEFAYTPSAGDSSAYSGIQYSGQESIIRFNVFRDTIGPGISMSLWPDAARYVTHNRIYNNDFYATSLAGIGLSGSTAYTFTDNIIKNNILTKSIFVASDTRWTWYTQTLAGKPVQVLTGRLDGFVFENNDLCNTAADEAYLITYGNAGSSSNPPGQSVSWWQANYPALFRGNLETDPQYADEAGEDFHLKAGSPMIDAGAFLTKTVGAGSGVILSVTDARYFFDGFDMTDENGLPIPGDLVQLEGDTKTTHVIDIDYVNNTLTLDQPLSWTDSQGVSLAYNGSAPDMGAYEYVEGALPTIGDVNGDSVVNALDVQACVNHILGTQDWAGKADVNKDSAINALDIQAIVNIILGV